ncbi:MAG: hypothetical protein H0T52_00165 [Lautropia sp.]|nr:hypothetical protein [Lautropia sp.]
MSKKQFERKEGESFEEFIRRARPTSDEELQQAVADWMKDETPEETDEAAEAYRLLQAEALIKEFRKI